MMTPYLPMKPDFNTRRVVVFDMDDTVFPEHAYVRSGFAAVGRHLFETRGVDGFFEEAWRRFEAGERGDIFDSTLQSCGVLPDKALVKSLVAYYRAHEPDIAPDDWVAPLVKQLRDSGRRIGVITDGPVVMQRAKVVALGLPALADAIVLSDALGGEATRKPAAAPFSELMNLIGATPIECVYIGDNPTKDFIGARRSGWLSIRLRIQGRLHSALEAQPGFESDAEVASASELARLLTA